MLPRRVREPFCPELEVIEDEKRSVVRWAVVHSPEPKVRCPLLPREPGAPLIPIQRNVINKVPNTMTILPPLDDARGFRGTGKIYRGPTPPALVESSPEIEEDLVADPWGVMERKKRPSPPRALTVCHNTENNINMAAPKDLLLKNRKPQPPSGGPSKRTVPRRVKKTN